MTVLTAADRIRLGTSGARRVYKGLQLVWQRVSWLDPAVGSVSTPDTADMGIDGMVRLLFGLRLTSMGTGFPSLMTKALGGFPGLELNVYAYQPSNNYMALSTANVGLTANVDVVMAQPFPLGAADHTLGIEFTPRSTAVVAILDGVRTNRVAGVPLGVPDTTAPVKIGGTAQLPGRVYWAQMEAINRARLVFPGVVGNYASVPDASNLDVTDDVEVVARITPTTWRPAAQMAIVGKYVPGTNNRSYYLSLLTAGQLAFSASTDGTSPGVVSAISSVATPAGNTPLWVKVTRVRTTGAVNFYTAPDSPTEPTVWTALGTTQTALTGVGMFAGTAPVEIGSIAAGAAQPFAGRIARAIVRNGIAGTTVLDIQENDAGTMATANTFVAASGQTVTVNQTLDAAYLTPTVGTVTTPDPGPVPAQCVWVFKVRGTTGTLASQWTTTAGEAGYIVRRDPANGVIWFTIAPTGGSGSAVSKYALMGPTTTFYAVAADQATGTMRSWHSVDGVTWTNLAPQSFPPFAVFDATSPVRIGSYPGGVTWDDRIYSAECRTGLDPAAGTVLWRFDAAEFPGGTGTSYTDPRGRTWTLSATGAIAPAVQPIVQPQADSVVWRFDANEYVGSGLSYTDPRGRVWTQSAAGAIAGP